MSNQSTTTEIDRLLTQKFSLEKKLNDTKAKLSLIQARMDEERQKERHDAEVELRRAEAKSEAQKLEARIAKEHQSAARYEHEPAIMARLQKAIKDGGFVLKHKVDAEGRPIGIGVHFPYRDPEVDLLEKWQYEPSIQGAADFFGILHKPS